MRKRRRVPRVSLNTSVATIQSLFIFKGMIINISEGGLRYVYFSDSKNTKEKTISNTDDLNKAEIIAVRTVQFFLPGSNDLLQLMCRVVVERINSYFIESSCEFIGLTSYEKLTIREYVDKSL